MSNCKKGTITLEHTSKPAGFLSRSPITPDPLRHGAGSDITDWFFKDAGLETWKRANPGAAADWDATLRRFGVE